MDKKSHKEKKAEKWIKDGQKMKNVQKLKVSNVQKN